MKTLCVITQKGGQGKTTLSVNLATAAERRRKTAIVLDLDPQCSASVWSDVRKHQQEKETPLVTAVPAPRIETVLQAAEQNGVDLAILDTVGKLETSSAAATRAADLALIPCEMGLLDVATLNSTRELLDLHKLKRVGVVNRAKPNHPLAEQTEDAFKRLDIETAPVRVGDRIAFRHATTLGLSVEEYEPKGKAAKEIAQLYRFIANQLEL